MTNEQKILKSVGHEVESAIPSTRGQWWAIGPIKDDEDKHFTTCEVRRQRVGGKDVHKFTVPLPHSELRAALRNGQLDKLVRATIQDDLDATRTAIREDAEAPATKKKATKKKAKAAA